MSIEGAMTRSDDTFWPVDVDTGGIAVVGGRRRAPWCQRTQPGSGRFLRGFLLPVLRMWNRALRRCSQRDRFAWKKIERIKDFL